MVIRKNINEYKENVHYKIFILPKTVEDCKRENEYLTFEGLLRVILTTKPKIAIPYIEWKKQTLFTVQMGTPKQAVCHHHN
jgi:hypothetical protein